MMKRLLTIAVTALLATPFSTQAEGTAIGGRISTLGMGAEMTQELAPHLNARVGVNGWSYDKSMGEGGIDYDARVDLFTGSALLDWHFFEGSFRFTGGIMLNANEFGLTGKPEAGTLWEVGTTSYDSELVGTLESTIDFNDIAPYVGIGWGNPIGNKGVNIVFDVGVLYQGSPSATLKAVGTDATIVDALQADLAIERANLQDDLSDFNIWPVASIGLSYQFQ